MKKQNMGYLMIAAAGILWGTIGPQVKILLNYHLSIQDIILWKMIFTVLIVFPFIFFTNRKTLKVDLKGLIQISLIGLLSQLIFNVLYFGAIQRTTVATAVTLMYTAPIFIAIMARIIYKELFTPFKTVALSFCLVGCFLSVTGGLMGTLKLNLPGVLMGVGTGFTFALLTILNKALIKKYHLFTIIAYSIGFGLIFYLPFSRPLNIFQIGLTAKVWLLLGSIGLTTAVAFGFFITGLSYGIEASKAGIITTLELVVSVILSYLIFKEALWGWRLIGILIVIFSVIIIQVNKILPNRSPSP